MSQRSEALKADPRKRELANYIAVCWSYLNPSDRALFLDTLEDLVERMQAAKSSAIVWWEGNNIPSEIQDLLKLNPAFTQEIALGVIEFKQRHAGAIEKLYMRYRRAQPELVETFMGFLQEVKLRDKRIAV